MELVDVVDSKSTQTFSTEFFPSLPRFPWNLSHFDISTLLHFTFGRKSLVLFHLGFRIFLPNLNVFSFISVAVTDFLSCVLVNSQFNTLPVWWNWQTWRIQNPLVATPCGFDPRHRHHNDRRFLFQEPAVFFLSSFSSSSSPRALEITSADEILDL